MNLNEAPTVETYVIGPAFDLPELTTIREVDWVDRHRPITVSTTYHDTADHQLARRGLTLHQQCDGDEGQWMLTSAGLRRQQAVGSGRIDDTRAVRPALSGLISGRELQPRLRVTTLRETFTVFDDDGQTMAEIHVDRVSAYGIGDRHLRRSWDALSLVFTTGENDEWADELRRTLTDRAAMPGEELQRSEEVLGVRLPERPRKLAGLIFDYLLPQLDRLILNDAALRQGVNSAHETRLAARKILSVLRVMDDCFATEPARQLTAELSWFAGILGIVTDCDTRRKRLRKALSGPNVAAAHLSGRHVVKQELDLDRQVAILTLEDALDSPRYAALLDMLSVWRTSMPFTSAATKRGKRNAKRYVERADTELEFRLSAIHSTASNGSLHAARIAARRTRFVAELAQPAIGKPAGLARAKAVEIQDRLGDHRDALITAELSNRLTSTLEGDGRNILISVADRIEHDVEVARKRSLSATTPR